MPEILTGLRQLPTRSGISPYLLCFKQASNWLGDVYGGSRKDIESPQGVEEEYKLLAQQVVWWEGCLDWVNQKLKARDGAMVAEYERQHQLNEAGVEFIHEPGDWVIMKQKRPGKLRARAMGPYKFVRYKGVMGVVAVLETLQGKQFDCSVANLAPLRAGVTKTQKWKANL